MIDEDDNEEMIYINPHCRYCGWVFPTTEEFCPMCGAPRFIEEVD